MLKRILFTVAAVIAMISAVDAAEWKIDAAHSTVGFEVRHLVISRLRGQFQEFDCRLKFDASALEAGSVEFTVQTASIDTDNEDRDKHLRTGEFFDTENHPTMTFKSSKVIKGDENKFKLVGDLTIRGVTKEVVFDCEFYGAVKDPWGNTKSGFSAHTEINRQDFKVSWSKSLDSGGLVVGDMVNITVDVEFAEIG